MDNKDKLKQYLERLRELNAIAFKSDEEQAEFEQLQKEVAHLMDSSIVTHEKQLEQNDALNIFDDVSKDFPVVPLKELASKEPSKDVVDLQLKELERQKTKLQTMIKVAKTGEEVEALKEKLAEIVREQSYFTSKPDKNGYIKINEDKFQQKLKRLEDKLAQANGFGEKLQIKMQIASLKMYKGTIKARNKAIWTGRGVRKVQGGIATIAKELEPLAKMAEYDQFSPKQKQDKKNKKEKKHKKGKKHKHKDSEDKDDQDKSNDYGFNTKNVFGKNKGENWF